jgi:HlyD family secretion protein
MASKKRRNRIIIIGLLLVVAGLIAFGAIRSQRPRGTKVETEKVETRTIREMVSASGKVFPQTEVKISSDVSGEIVELFVEEGDSVIQGQLLAKIDPEVVKSQVERGDANLNSTKAQLANARSQVENSIAQKEQIQAQLVNAREIHRRNEELKKDGVISEADFDASLSNVQALEANLRSAEASIKAAKESVRSSEYQVKSAEATLKELKTSLIRTSIFAPSSGIISRLDVEQGERVVGTIQMTGTEMMRIANLNAMEVRVEVSENDIPRVSIGDEVAIEVDAYIDRTFRGTVTQIANSAVNVSTTTAALTNDQVTNFEVRINIDPASYQDLVSPTQRYPFRPGMSATVEINTETLEEVISIPIQAVTTREKEDKKGKEDILEDDIMEVVFVVKGDTVHMQQVKTGIQDDSYIRVIEGLELGDEVVTGPYNAVARVLEAGEAVIVENEDESEAEEE